MQKSRIFRFAALLSLGVAGFGISSASAATGAFGGPVPERTSGNQTTSVSGVYQVTFNLTVASTLPANSTIVCKAAIVPALRSNGGMNQTAVIPLEIAASAIPVAGGTATCVVEIPFAWTLADKSNGALLSFEVKAVNAAGVLPDLVRSSVQQGIAEPYPAAGSTSSLTFNLTF
jgi:hypothetical protein